MYSRLRALTSLGVGLALLTLAFVVPSEARAQAKKAEFKRVTIKTFDGVELAGTFYPPPAGGKDKDAVVMLIHHFDAAKGGGQHKDGWGDLAARLQRDGYAVLSFDFRGFGDSKTVDTEFWDVRKFPHNQSARKRPVGKMLPVSIDHKDFKADYYPYLVNDVAAAKAFLDRRNDASEVNTSNTIVIAAGDGATAAALWMAQECRRKRDKNPPNGIGVVRPNLAEAEGKDIACAVFLTINTKIGNRSVGGNGPLKAWIKDAGKNGKIPLAFVYGEKDDKGMSLSKSLLKEIKMPGVKGGPFALTGEHAVKNNKLSGSALLNRATLDWIADNYLDPVMDKRGAKERRTRAVEKWRYFYELPGRQPMLAKRAGDEIPYVNLALFGLTR